MNTDEKCIVAKVQADDFRKPAAHQKGKVVFVFLFVKTVTGNEEEGHDVIKLDKSSDPEVSIGKNSTAVTADHTDDRNGLDGIHDIIARVFL